MRQKWSKNFIRLLALVLFIFWIGLPTHAHSATQNEAKDHCSICQVQLQKTHFSATYFFEAPRFQEETVLSSVFQSPTVLIYSHVTIRGPPSRA